MAASQAEIQEMKEDIFFGQVIIIWARWFTVLGIAAVIFLNVKETQDLLLGLIPVLILMLMNFFVHGSYLMEKPVGQGLILITSAVDLVVVSMLVLIGPAAVGRGFDSQLFVFYYPLVLAFAFVMPQQWAIAYTVLTLIIYVILCLFNIGQIEGRELFVRVLTLGGTGGLASYYWRIMRNRRRTALGSGSGQPTVRR